MIHSMTVNSIARYRHSNSFQKEMCHPSQSMDGLNQSLRGRECRADGGFWGRAFFGANKHNNRPTIHRSAVYVYSKQGKNFGYCVAAATTATTVSRPSMGGCGKPRLVRSLTYRVPGIDM